MSCKLVLVPSFPGLLDCLLHKLRISCLEDPLEPKWVVVPTSTVANHLRIRLGREAGESVLSGVRVIPIVNFIDRFVARDGNPNAQRWDCSLDLLLFELVQSFSHSSLLGVLREMSSGYRFLRPTFLDLADGGFGLDQCEILQELSEDSELSPLEREVISLYVSWLQLLENRGLNWKSLQQQQVPQWISQVQEEEILSSLACEKGQSAKVFVYGFYDFTDTNVEIISSLAQRVPMVIFYPFIAKHTAFSFADDVLEDLKIRLGTALEDVEKRGDTPKKIPYKPETEDFFLSTFPEGNIPERPSFLTFQRASGIRSELLCAALQVRQWLDDSENPIPLHQIMVVAPDLKPYSEIARQIFDAFAIPVRIIDTPTELTPKNQPLKMIARLWEDRAPAEWVLSYLRKFPQLEVLVNLDLSQFESKIRQAGIWGGSSWNLIVEFEGNGKVDGGGRHEFPSFTEEEKQLVREIFDLWGRDTNGGQRQFKPQEAIYFLNKIQERWLPEPSLLDSLLTGLENMKDFCPDLLISEALLREEMTQFVGEQIQSDSMNQDGVLALPLMRARGLTAKAIVFLGLSSDNLPARIQEDPLFSDISRGRLVDKAGVVGHRLPIKSHITDEMSLLFFLLNTSADLIHWVIPESDEMGRSVAPTPWVQRYVQFWESNNPKVEKDKRRMPRGPVEQARYLLELDDDKGLFLPPAFLDFIQSNKPKILSTPSDLYHLESDRNRKREAVWNGCVPEAAMPVLNQKEQKVNVTALEELAKCPFRYYANGLVKWTPLVPLEFSNQLSPLDWGNLVHKCLEFLMQPYRGQEVPLQKIAGQLLESNAKQLKTVMASLSNYLLDRLKIIPIPFSQLEINRLEKLLKDYFETVANRENGENEVDRFLVDLELKLRVPFPGLKGVNISGKIDRIDQQGNDFYICDYKSGLSPQSTTLFSKEVSLGHTIQPILYPWIFSKGKNNSSGSVDFSFVYLKDSPPSEKPVPYEEKIEEFLKPLAGILRNGMYVPTPDQTMERLKIEAKPCLYCQYISLCRRFDQGAYERYADFFSQKMSSRLNSMLQSSQSKGKK